MLFHHQHGWCWLPSVVRPWLDPGLKFKFELFPPMRTPRPRQQQQYPQPAPATVCKLGPGPMGSRRLLLI